MNRHEPQPGPSIGQVGSTRNTMSDASYVMEIIIERLRSRSLPPGARLPSALAIAHELDVDLCAARDALATLARWNVVRIDTQGHFQATDYWAGDIGRELDRCRPLLKNARKDWIFRTVSDPQVLTASPGLAERLGIAPGGDIFHLRRLRWQDGGAIAHDEHFLPRERFPDTPDAYHALQGAIDLLKQNAYVIGKVVENVSAVSAGEHMAEMLEIPADEPLLRIERVLYDQQDSPLELRVTHLDLKSQQYVCAFS